MSEAADTHQNELLRAFPKTRAEFEERFSTEEACRAFLIDCPWHGEPACARCGCKTVWPERGGKLFECSDCRHQTSVTSERLFHRFECYSVVRATLGSRSQAPRRSAELSV